MYFLNGSFSAMRATITPSLGGAHAKMRTAFRGRGCWFFLGEMGSF